MSEFIKETKFIKSSVDGKNQRYLIQYPEHTASDLLVVYLHSGIYPAEQGFKHTKEWGFGYVGDETLRRDGVYISPDYRGDSWFNDAAEQDIYDIINSTRERFNIITTILVGTSMGGGAALAFAARHKNIINGVIVTAPALDMLAVYKQHSEAHEYFNRSIIRSIDKAYGGSPSEIGEEYYRSRSAITYADKLQMPIVIRQGDKDRMVPVEIARKMACALLEHNQKVFYDEIPFATHDTVTNSIPWTKYFDFIIDN